MTYQPPEAMRVQSEKRVPEKHNSLNIFDYWCIIFFDDGWVTFWPLWQAGSNQGRGSDALSPLYVMNFYNKCKKIQ